MNANERYLYLLAAEREFTCLCNRIVHDGRDPMMVAYGMCEQLAGHLAKYQTLLESVR